MIIEYSKSVGDLSITEVSEKYPLPSVSGLRGPIFTTEIVSGTTVSSSGTVLEIPNGYRISSLRTPPEGWVSGTVSFDGSWDGGVYEPIYSVTGGLYTVTPVTGAVTAIPYDLGCAVSEPPYVRLVAPSGEATISFILNTASK